MLWIKALHLVAVISWMAGLLYLPRLFVYHCMAKDRLGRERFQIMERRLYYGIMYPSFIASFSTGLLMLYSYAWQAYHGFLWLHLKLALVSLLILYHFSCGYWMKCISDNRKAPSHIFFRVMNEIPWLLMFGIIVLVIVKPFSH